MEKIERIESGEYDIFRGMKEAPHVERGKLGDVLKACEEIYEDDFTRPMLSNVYFDTENGNGNVVATDGHIMAVVKIANINGDFDGKAVLFQDRYKEKYEKEWFPSQPTFDDCFVYDKDLNRYVCKGKYPNWSAVIPKEKTMKYTLTVEECIRAYDALKYQMQFLNNKKSRFRIKFAYDGREHFEEYKGSYILKALNVIRLVYGNDYDWVKYGKVEFLFNGGDGKALVITCGAILIILMPVVDSDRINEWNYVVDLETLPHTLQTLVNDKRAKLLVNTINNVLKNSGDNRFRDSFFSFPKENDSDGYIICFNQTYYDSEFECYCTDKEPFKRIFGTTTIFDTWSNHDGNKEYFQKTWKNIHKININDFLSTAKKHENNDLYDTLLFDFGEENGKEKKVAFHTKSFVSVVDFFKNIGCSELMIGDCISQISGNERIFITAYGSSDDFVFLIPEFRYVSAEFTYELKNKVVDENGRLTTSNVAETKNNAKKENDKKETEIDIDMVRVKMIMVAKALKAKREREQMEREKKESNFSLGENGDVRINLAKKPKNWTYYDTPYGRLLKIPSKEYVTNDKEWSMSAFRQANEYDGYVFVFASLIPKKGYRPIDFDRDSEVADYIDNNIVKH